MTHRYPTNQTTPLQYRQPAAGALDVGQRRSWPAVLLVELAKLDDDRLGGYLRPIGRHVGADLVGHGRKDPFDDDEQVRYRGALGAQLGFGENGLAKVVVRMKALSPDIFQR